MFRSMILSAIAVSVVGTVVAWRQQPSTAPHVTPAAIQHVSENGRDICATGVVEGRTREIALRFEIAGRLDELLVREGSRVQAGQLLAKLDASSLLEEVAKVEAAVEIAKAEKERLVNGARRETLEIVEAEIRAAKARYQQARKSLARSEKLAKSGAVPQQEVDDLDGAAKKARAEVEVTEGKLRELSADAREDEVKLADAKITLEQARVRHARSLLEKSELRAPSDGIVLRLRGEPGELVEATGDSVITIVDPSELYVRAHVEELDAIRVVQQMQAEVSVDGMPGLKIAGRVVSCAPTMTTKTQLRNQPGERSDVKVREVLVRLEGEASERLVIGLPVDIMFHASGDQASPTIPTTAKTNTDSQIRVAAAK